MSGAVGFGATSPSTPFTMLGSSDAVACVGDSCLVAPPGILGASTDGSPDDEPGRRGVSR
ncbi:hypothetical protein EDF50_0623 [Frigoribacterium sp. PhB24]|nr:hypothetical protein EDF50_0623 [Frigoribacterium sp. PhB24]